MLETRLLNTDDYDTLVSWWDGWKDWKGNAPPKEFLPQNGTGGIMISNDDVDICAGFLYTTNSKIAWLEFIVSNPNYRNKDRKEAIVMLIDVLCNIANELGFKAVFTSVKNPFLINHLKNVGFSLEATKSYEMVKRW